MIIPLEILKEIELLTYSAKQHRLSDYIWQAVKDLCNRDGHVGDFRKICDIADDEFADRQYGYKCVRCGAIKMADQLTKWHD